MAAGTEMILEAAIGNLRKYVEVPLLAGNQEVVSGMTVSSTSRNFNGFL